MPKICIVSFELNVCIRTARNNFSTNLKDRHQMCFLPQNLQVCELFSKIEFKMPAFWVTFCCAVRVSLKYFKYFYVATLGRRFSNQCNWEFFHQSHKFQAVAEADKPQDAIAAITIMRVSLELLTRVFPQLFTISYWFVGSAPFLLCAALEGMCNGRRRRWGGGGRVHFDYQSTHN